MPTSASPRAHDRTSTQRSPRRVLMALIACAAWLAIAPSVRAEEAVAAPERPKAKPGDTIRWMRDLPAAFEKAKTQRKVLMICINSRQVDGKARMEPAAKGLREVVYKHVRVVDRSRDFVCCYLESGGSSADFGELRARFGLDGLIVSPQHIFAHPDHEEGAPLVRMEYWSYGQGDRAVDALVGLMDKADARYRAKAGLPPAPEGTAPPAEGASPPDESDTPAPVGPIGEAERLAWIEGLVKIIREGGQARREEALRTLIANDKEGDVFPPLVALVADDELEKDVELQVAVIRALGRPELEIAVAPVVARLKHKDPAVRANAAVSLEYIGSATAKPDLLKRVKAERETWVAGHIARALGRCGQPESKVRSALTKKAGSAKEDTDSYAPIIGLAYFQGDAKAARAIEKLMAKLGPPSFGRRGGGRGVGKRAVLAWCLGMIGDPKSVAFMDERMIKPIRNVRSRWLAPTLEFYENVKLACQGDEEARGALDTAVTGALRWSGGNPAHDDARKGREGTGFTPLGDWEVQGRGGRGGGRGGRGGDDD